MQVVVTSTKWWDGLPADVREQFATILTEVTQTRNAESNRVEQQNKQYVIEAGGVVRELTPEQRAEWVTALKPVWNKFEKDIGSDLIEAALAANKK